MHEPRTLNLAIAVDEDFARKMTDEEAQQLGLVLKARARHELGLERDDEAAAMLDRRVRAKVSE